MKFGELLTVVAQLRSQLSAVDVSLLGGDNAACLAQELAPLQSEVRRQIKEASEVEVQIDDTG